MKKHEAYKTVQLILMLVLAVTAIVLVFGNMDVYHSVAQDPYWKVLGILLWLILLVSFIFIYLDFKFFFLYKKEYREMGYAVHSDPVSGINNRFSCDVLIEQYLDKPLPKDMGCIMIDITNIREINQAYGYVKGNMAIRRFSEMMASAGEDLCFVGRNGGNKFLAIFEDTTAEKMDLFLQRLKEKVLENNENKEEPELKYHSGRAFHEDDQIQGITQLIALSNRRIYDADAK